MADLTFNGMEISVKKFGEHDFHVKYKSLDRTFTPDEMAQLIFPLIEKMEMQSAAAMPASHAAPDSSAT